MRTIRWGMIGCGDVTEVKSGPAFQKAKNSALVAVMRRNGELAADYARRHGVATWYDDADALVKDPEVDAVYIATPPYAHLPYTLVAAQAGKPVYVEKPMARDAGECEAMLAACEAAAVPLFVAYYRRALPRFVTIKELVDGGALGEIRSVSVLYHRPPSKGDLAFEEPWRVDPELAGGGYFMDLASHTLDFLDYALGPIAQVTGHTANQAGHYRAEDIVTASFRFASGGHGVGSWSFSAFAERDLVTLTGSKGEVSFSSFGSEALRLVTAEGEESFEVAMPEHVQQPLIQSIVDDLNGASGCPSTGFTAKVLDSLLRDYRLGNTAS
ncbi:MAG: Gfo/Idh/MocA family oxidoreductase [Deinococcota bacterium]|nr:Gfo/Idh/MocA family oxidoreductase [Deinococcota bacterium]